MTAGFDGFAAINEIVKRRYETGGYANTYFEFSFSVFEAARRHISVPTSGLVPAPSRPGVYSLSDLLSIPIVVNDALPAEEWRLVDFLTGGIVHRGVLSDSPGLVVTADAEMSDEDFQRFRDRFLAAQADDATWIGSAVEVRRRTREETVRRNIVLRFTAWLLRRRFRAGTFCTGKPEPGSE